MKKRLLRFFLGILYIDLMAALLILYVQNITGDLERMFAVAGTLALAAPAVVILILYIRLKNREEDTRTEAGQKKKESISEKITGEPSSEETSLPPIPRTSHTEMKFSEIKSSEMHVLKIEQMEELEERLRPFSLSKREMEVAWLLYRGYTNRQIAEELYIAETTVKKHVTHIYEKVQVFGRKEYKEKLRKIQ